MSIPAIQNLGPFRAGDDLDIGVVITSNGEVVDLTGCTVMFEMSRTPSSTPVLSTEDTAPTATADIDVPAEGSVDIAALGEDTVDLVGVYHFEVKVVDATDKVHTPLVGLMSFEPRVL